ncbi:MAG: ATP-binding protein [Okeania sp. SIO3B5]|uniref:ATP-binding protein n=1 Tax=Okeania sp. SIO3B5 TaxID=2607811 RepID=UPI0013FFCDCB|nr:ATP-binding protein [Okeania sp. SIO3B5]NEO52858.1 ATP-binding protein [Okeania sp. SIO3B5]
MTDLKEFRRATNPNKALNIENAQDKAYYIDFASVRGGKVITKLKNKITVFDTDEPTCSLFTGHIGCGKSTELLRLKVELENKNFHVVYFESSEDLDVGDVDLIDVLLVIARRISENLEENQIKLEATGLKKLIKDVWQGLNAEVKGLEIGIPKLGKIGGGTTNKEGEFSLSFGIGKITMMAKSDQKLRQQLNQYLGPQKIDLIKTINQELLEPAIAKLKQKGKEGLVVIVDNLDRIDNTVKSFGIPQQEYLFIDQGEFLKGLNCHLVYTMPLSLMFSNDFGRLENRFGEAPDVLPMVPVKFKNGKNHKEGMELLQKMVLARVFPNIEPEQRLHKITEIFDSTETLERLCRVSGGHVRDLLSLLSTLIMEEMQLPLSGKVLETVIRTRRNKRTMAISDQEWELLRQVKQRKKVSDDIGYQKLIRSHFVFEYIENDESWFDINPILAEALELQ